MERVRERRYLGAAATAGVRVTPTVSDEEVRQVLLALHPAGGRPRGDSWGRCVEQRAAVERWLGDGLRLTKIRKLLVRPGVDIASPTLHRFAVLELQFGKTATTIPVLDGEPGQGAAARHGLGRPAHAAGEEAAVSRLDLYRGALAPPLRLSHLRGNDGAREACDAAWDFFGGVFKVIIPDNTKAIIIDAIPEAPLTPAFLEYAHARHFHIDPAGVRSPRDTGPAPVGREGEEIAA